MKITSVIILTMVLCINLVLSQENRYQMIEIETFSLGGGETFITWSPSDITIAVTNTDNVFLCNLGKDCTTLSEEIIPLVTSLSWHPSKDLLATSGSRFNVWDITNGQNIHVLDFPENEATDGMAQWSNDGDFLAFTTSKLVDEEQAYTAYLWSMNENIFMEIPVDINTGLHTIEWSFDNTTLAISDFDSLSLWNSSLNEVTSTLGGYSNIYEVCSSPADTLFIFGGWTLSSRLDSIYVLNDITDTPSNLDITFDNAVTSIDCNPVYTNLVATGTLSGQVTVVDIDNQEVVLNLALHDFDNAGEITDVVWNSAGDRLAIGDNQGNIIIFSLNRKSEN